jgi:hypothetical protein
MQRSAVVARKVGIYVRFVVRATAGPDPIRTFGGPEQPVGHIGSIERDMPGSAVSNFVQVLRPDQEKVDASFLGWTLFKLQRTGIVDRVQLQSTQMRDLNWRDYQHLMLPWPEGDEQRLIAAPLKLADDVIQKAREELQAARDLKSSLVCQGLFGKFLATIGFLLNNNFCAAPSASSMLTMCLQEEFA